MRPLWMRAPPSAAADDGARGKSRRRRTRRSSAASLGRTRLVAGLPPTRWTLALLANLVVVGLSVWQAAVSLLAPPPPPIVPGAGALRPLPTDRSRIKSYGYVVGVAGGGINALLLLFLLAQGTPALQWRVSRRAEWHVLAYFQWVCVAAIAVTLILGLIAVGTVTGDPRRERIDARRGSVERGKPFHPSARLGIPIGFGFLLLFRILVAVAGHLWINHIATDSSHPWLCTSPYAYDGDDALDREQQQTELSRLEDLRRQEEALRAQAQARAQGGAAPAVPS